MISNQTKDQLVWSFRGDNDALDAEMFLTTLRHEGITLSPHGLAALVEEIQTRCEVYRRCWRLKLARQEAAAQIDRLLAQVDAELAV